MQQQQQQQQFAGPLLCPDVIAGFGGHDAAVVRWRREVQQRSWLPTDMLVFRPPDEARFGRYLERYASPSAKQIELVELLGSAASPAMRASCVTPCLQWSGPERIEWSGRKWIARRLFYELCVGPIPPGHICVSVCDGASYCVEPKHMETRPRPKPGRSGIAAAFCEAADRVVAEETARLQDTGFLLP